MNCGTVLYDKAFQFSDGPEGQKLAVVLCEFGYNHLIVKTTTSQRVDVKKKVPGCQHDDTPPNYFLPRNTCWFTEDTWIELDEIFELDSSVHKEKTKDGTIVIQSNLLDLELMKRIIDCALQCEDDIDGFYLDHLRVMRKKM